MSIITLTSDWQNNSVYHAIIKGFISKNSPNTNIIDLKHNIAFMNVAQAAFVIKSCYEHFPENTVHIIAINAEANQKQKPLIVQAENQYFIANNNGIFNLLFDKPVDNIIEIENANFFSTFPELDVFANVACKFLNGTNVFELGKKITKFNKLFALQAYCDENTIEGKILYIDNYLNVITNITKDVFETERNGRSFVINLKSMKFKIEKISKNYNSIEQGELLAIFNSLGYLELAQAKGRLAEMFQLSVNDVVRVRFGKLKRPDNMLFGK